MALVPLRACIRAVGPPRVWDRSRIRGPPGRDGPDLSSLPAKAIACYQHAIDLYRDLGHRRGGFGALTCLGDTHQSADDPAAARAAWQEALAILVDLAHPDVDKIRSKLADGDTQPSSPASTST